MAKATKTTTSATDETKTSAPAKAAPPKAAAKPAAKPVAAAKPKAAAKPPVKKALAKAASAPETKAVAAKKAPVAKKAEPAKAAVTMPAPAEAEPKAVAKKPSAVAKAAAPKATAEKAPAKPAAKSAAKPKAAPAAKAPAPKTPAPKVSSSKASSSKNGAPRPAVAPKATPAASPAAAVSQPAAPVAAKSKSQAAATSSKPWLANYPAGIPAEIGPLEHSSLGDLMVSSCRKFGPKPAFTSMGKSISFADLEKQSAAFAAYLQGKGLSKGARVAIMMPNVLQYPIAMMAVLRAGHTVVNVNPLYTPRELEHQLNDSGAEAIVILENFASTLQAVIGRTKVKHVVVAAMGDMLGLKGFVVNLVVRRVKKMVPTWSLPGHVAFPAALKEGSKKTFRKIDVSESDVAFLQYTGGTTGVSKGATLTHKNVLANVAQNALWVEAAYAKKKKPENVVYVCALPLYHIYALTVNALMGMQQGAQNILIANPRDIPTFVKELGKTPFHVFPGLNTLFNALLNNAEFQKLDFKPLLLTFGGGMAVQRPVADRWKKLTGITIAEGYGLSETAPVATANRFDADEFSGTIGLPIPSTEIVIRDEAGKDVAIGEVGEICIRGPQVMAGYWNRPEETAKVMSDDGFFKSGDMGFMDDKGYVKIVDRKKDMILVSGFNVYPNEIEEVVAEHPGVLEVAAIGVPDEHSGEVPKLFVVRKDEKLTEKEIIDFTRDKLTGYKRPKHVEFRKELPKTNVGKILRRELR